MVELASQPADDCFGPTPEHLVYLEQLNAAFPEAGSGEGDSFHTKKSPPKHLSSNPAPQFRL